MTDHKKISELFANELVRIERLIWIAATGGEPMSDDLLDAFALMDEDGLERCFGYRPDGLDVNDKDEIVAWLFDTGKLGVLACFETPIMEEGDSYSWGFCRQNWLYAETLEELADKAVAWAREKRRERA